MGNCCEIKKKKKTLDERYHDEYGDLLNEKTIEIYVYKKLFHNKPKVEYSFNNVVFSSKIKPLY
jgi:hypothetical protein